jgi:hypothetical protein
MSCAQERPRMPNSENNCASEIRQIIELYFPVTVVFVRSHERVAGEIPINARKGVMLDANGRGYQKDIRRGEGGGGER